MLRGKKALIGKILLVILLIILIIGAIIGITAYQVYGVYKTAVTEKEKIESNTALLQKEILKGDCSRLKDINESVNKIKKEIEDACHNPLIKMGVKKAMANNPIQTPAGNVVVSCDNLDSLESQYNSQIGLVNNICSNQTLMNALKYRQGNNSLT